ERAGARRLEELPQPRHGPSIARGAPARQPACRARGHRLNLTPMRKLLLCLSLSGLLATGYAFADDAKDTGGGAAKNLKILPKDMPKAEIKKLMKKVASALGVQCEHCHDTDDFSKDTEKKEIARTMMKMSAEINKEFFKDEMKVGCVTCHNGAKVPKKPG